jgi:hypothetical protein
MGRNNTVSYNARFIGAFTNSTYPDAANVQALSQMYVSDSVFGGLEKGFYSAIGGAWVNDREWNGLEYPVIVHSSGTPFGLPSSGTVGANGALSGLTAFNVTYVGIWLYFPAGAVYAGSLAGLYWCVMSGTTAGTIYNNRLTIPGSLDAPATPTPIVAAGPGAYTQTTGVAITAFGRTVPAGSMGAGGQLRIADTLRYSATVNAKTKTETLGGVTLRALANANATQQTISDYFVLQNRGTTSQITASPGSATVIGGVGGFNNTGLELSGPIDTTVNQTFAMLLTLATATDWVVCERVSLDAYITD